MRRPLHARRDSDGRRARTGIRPDPPARLQPAAAAAASPPPPPRARREEESGCGTERRRDGGRARVSADVGAAPAPAL